MHTQRSACAAMQYAQPHGHTRCMNNKQRAPRVRIIPFSHSFCVDWIKIQAKTKARRLRNRHMYVRFKRKLAASTYTRGTPTAPHRCRYELPLRNCSRGLRHPPLQVAPYPQDNASYARCGRISHHQLGNAVQSSTRRQHAYFSSAS